LASASPRRLALLAQIGVVPDSVLPADIDETPKRAELPRVYAMRMAREKVGRVAVPGSFTLAADTVVAVGRRIVGKAETASDAAAYLKLLSGRRHHVITAVALVAPDGRLSHRVSDSTVVFARLTAPQIAAYVATGEWAGKAGAYAVQGRAASFVRALHGSYSGVVGLPLFETAQLLAGRGYVATPC
jgi:septum formation protein